MQRLLVLGGVMLLAGLVSGALGGAVVGYRVGHAPVPVVTRDRDELRVALDEAQFQLSGTQRSLGSAQVERNGLQRRVNELEAQLQSVKAEHKFIPPETSRMQTVVSGADGSTVAEDRRGRAWLRVKTIGGDGKFVQLTDGTIYEICPASWSEARTWASGLEVRITQGEGSFYPVRIISAGRGEVLHAEVAASK